MTDLSNLPPEVREALQEVQVVFDVNEHQPWADKEAHEILRDYILRVTAERDALERQIADAPHSLAYDMTLLPVIDAALAAPQSAEAVAPKPVRALHDRSVYIAITRNEDYEEVDDVLVASDFLETPDGFEWEVITSPTDTLRQPHSELVWNKSDSECARAWFAVVDVLNKVSPRWWDQPMNGQNCAVAAITALAAKSDTLRDACLALVKELNSGKLIRVGTAKYDDATLLYCANRIEHLVSQHAPKASAWTNC